MSGLHDIRRIESNVVVLVMFSLTVCMIAFTHVTCVGHVGHDHLLVMAGARHVEPTQSSKRLD